MRARETANKPSRRTINLVFTMIGLVFALTAFGETSAFAKTIPVTSTGDTVAVDGFITLREAITAANTNAPSGDAPAGDLGIDTITFNINASGVQTINLLSPLPTITEPIQINGYSQPGASANTLSVGSDAVMLIELNGSGTVNVSGLVITAGNSMVRGLVINRFAYQAISLQTNGNNVIAGNYIGTNASGTAAFPSPNDNVGVYVTSANNTIGGTTAADRNVISGNGLAGPGGTGVLIGAVNATGNKVIGNYIGTSASGTVKVPNFNTGVVINNANANVVRGATPAERNVISGNGSYGITIAGTSSNNHIIGNFIGTQPDGVSALKNNFGGMSFVNTASGNVIGGTAQGEGNVIAFHNGQGVFVGTQNVNNAILGNSIYSNSGLGIELYSGALGVTPASKQTLIDNLQNAVRDRAHTLEDFIQTPEMSGVGTKFYDRGFIAMQYFGYLRRDPDAAGFDFWQQKMSATNHDYRFMVGGFLNSDEHRFRFALLPLAP